MNGFIQQIGPGEAMAIGSSLAYAVALVLLRQGLRTASPLGTVVVLNTSVCAIALVASLVRGTLQSSSLVPLLWFMAAGCVGSGLGKLLYCIGIDRIGVSRSAPVQSSTPIWGVLVAMLVLGERPGIPVLLGTAGIVSGVFLLSLAEGKDEGEENSGGRWFQGALIFPLGSSILFSIPPVFIKFAYLHQQTPLVATTLIFFAGLATVLAARGLFPGRTSFAVSRRALPWILVAGIFNFLTGVFYYAALTFGQVSTVLPLSRLTPLWVVLLTYFFLGKLERLTSRVIIAAALVVAGGVLITAFRV